MSARTHRNAVPRDWRLGRFTMPQMTVRRALGHLVVPLIPASIGAARGHAMAACAWLLVGVALFVLRNVAVAWEVRQGWHDPVFGPMRQARRQAEHERLTRPMAKIMTVALVLGTALLMLLEQHRLIALPTPHVPAGARTPLPPLPPCCAPSPDHAVHQAWRLVLRAETRAR